MTMPSNSVTSTANATIFKSSEYTCDPASNRMVRKRKTHAQGPVAAHDLRNADVNPSFLHLLSIVEKLLHESNIN